jgi:putative DNA methylase
VNDPKKKLIEVALPLEAINQASAREKSIRHGHPSTLHLWWARRPLAAARAVIFAQMVDDPSEHVEELLSDSHKKHEARRELFKRHQAWAERKATYEEAQKHGETSVPAPGPEPTLKECVADIERERLFEIIRELVKWENTTNDVVLTQARNEILRSWRATCAENNDHPRAAELFNPDKLPAFHDPFAGGGALPLEAQRLGLESYASDLNPVAVLINKAMIEIPPKFAGQSPVNPEAQRQKAQMDKRWQGAQGLAEDVHYYGKWMRDEAEKRIGHLYPKIEITAEMAKERPDLKPYVGQWLTVIAWLWARTVKSPNPAFAHLDVPLASTFMLSTKLGKEAYVEPVVESDAYRFTVMVGKPKNGDAAKSGTKLAGANFRCVMSASPISGDYIKAEGRAGRMGARMMAIVAEGERGRVYLAPTPEMEVIAQEARPTWKPDVEFLQQALGFRIGNYGLTRWSDLFTPRQLVALTTFSDCVQEARERVKRDALTAELPDDGRSLDGCGTGVTAYADAVATYLAFLVDQVANHSSSVCGWNSANAQMRSVFARQALPMVWDYAESNPFCDSSGSFNNLFERQVKGFAAIGGGVKGVAIQADANSQKISNAKIVSTDPPYYDNIGYADLSDFFYVWLRRSLKPVFPELFATMTVPKAEELVATPYRHGGKTQAEIFFMQGMTQAMHRLAELSHPAFPVTIYYAFKQSETESEGNASTGWETFLDAVIQAGFAISGTWPMRTEKEGRVRDVGSNALASSIVLVCCPRSVNVPTASRREFLNHLKAELPIALTNLQRGNIAPVDLAQAAIGPGMAVYTQFAKVLDAEGKAMKVREALALINQTLDKVLSEQEGDFDADTRWALAWFEQFGFNDGPFGDAETLSKAKNTAIGGLETAGIVITRPSKVRLLRPADLPTDWDPTKDTRLTVWEMVHHLVRVLEAGGEGAAAGLAAKLDGKAEIARELAYRLYTVCERKKRAAEALSYNALVQSWPEITRLAREGGEQQEPDQGGLFE